MMSYKTERREREKKKQRRHHFFAHAFELSARRAKMTAADPLSGAAAVTSASHTSAARPEVGGSLHEDQNNKFTDANTDLHASSLGTNHAHDNVVAASACKVVVTMGASSYTAGDTVAGTVRVECTEAVKGKVRTFHARFSLVPPPTIFPTPEKNKKGSSL